MHCFYKKKDTGEFFVFLTSFYFKVNIKSNNKNNYNNFKNIVKVFKILNKLLQIDFKAIKNRKKKLIQIFQRNILIFK